MMIEHFRLLAGFNRWANGRVYDAAAALRTADYYKTRACAFFGSIHGTLNHLLVVDLLWFGRLAAAVPAISRLADSLSLLRPLPLVPEEENPSASQ